MRKYIVVISLLHLLLFFPSKTEAQIQEGDTMQFWSVSYIDWPPLWGVPQRVVEAVCRKVGQHCYIFVEAVSVQPLQVNIDALAARFDMDFFPQLTAKYGPVPDALDNDSSIFILAFDESNWAGYFDPGQQMTDSMVFATWNMRSNERELIYIAVGYIDYDASGITAHEFGHLLHWQQDHSPEPPLNPVKYWEDVWVDEGFSTFATVYLTENLLQHNVYDNWAFFGSNPDIPLVFFTNYSQARLFMVYMFEHFGNWSYISALIDNQLNGAYGVDSTLHALGYTERFDDVFEQWCITNYIDDSVFAGGKYGYTHYSLPSCFLSGSYTSFPTSLINGSVSAYAADYIKFKPSGTQPLMIEFSGDSTSVFRLSFVLRNAGVVVGIRNISLNSAGQGAFIADSMGILYDELIMVAINLDSTLGETGKAQYTYRALPLSSSGKENSLKDLIIFPNPATSVINISGFPRDAFMYPMMIVDSQGRIVFRNNISSEKESLNIDFLNPGMYFLIVRSNDGVICTLFEKSGK